MIKSKFTFFQVQVEGAFANASKLAKPGFCDGPKVLNTINMVVANCKFIAAVLNSIMLLVAEVYKSVISPKSISVNSRVLVDLLLDNGHQSGSGAVFNHLGIHLAASLDQPENYMLALCSTTSDSPYSSGTKVAFVDLNFACIKGALLLTVIGDSLSDLTKNLVNSFPRNTSQFSNFCCLDVQCKQLNYLSDFGLRNS